MSSNTVIQLLRSYANSAPLTLNDGEPAYSFVSRKLFIGNNTTGILTIGGEHYTTLIDANTYYATPGTIVTRDVTGGSEFNNVLANTVNANNTIYAGLGGAEPLPGATNPIIGGGGDANNYVQVYVRNINAGRYASADFIAYPDNGSDVSGWLDLGIGSSSPDPDEFYSIIGTNEGYLMMSAPNGSGSSGNLVIATDSTGTYNDIVFSTGGFTGDHPPIAHFRSGQGLVVDATTFSTGNGTGALVVAGGASIGDSLHAEVIYDSNNRVLTEVTTKSGPGISVSNSRSGSVETITYNNTGVISLTANTNELTANTTTGNLVVGLATTTVSAATYGGVTQIPSFTVDNFGRLTFAGNNTISTSFTIAGNTGSPDVVNTSETLTLIGNGTGITTAITDNKVTFATDNTVVRSNTSTIGPQSILTDVSITGNLTVQGAQTISNTTIVQTTDSLIKLASNNVTDVLDIGFYGQYDSSGTKYAGLFRKAADQFYLFKDVDTDPTGNVITFTSANRATLDTNITGGTVSGLAANVAIADGGTNANAFVASQITYFDGTRLSSLANTGTAGTYGSNAYLPVITTDDYGRVSNVSNTAIGIDTSQVITGILPIARGGSNNDTYTSGALLRFNGTGFSSVANTGTAGTYGNTSYIPVITTDDYGRVSGVTNTAISMDASQITSGTLPVVYGGTGSSSFTANGVVISSMTSTGALTSVTGSSYQVMQLNAAGIPVFAGLNGGTF